MIVGRILGWVLVALALGLAGAELLASLAAGAWQPMPLGSLWYDWHRASLNMAQAGIQRHLYPALWDPAIVTVLRWPAWVVFGGLGLVLLALFRRRGRRRKRRFG